MKIYVKQGKLYIGDFNNKSTFNIKCDDEITDMDGTISIEDDSVVEAFTEIKID